MKRGSLQPVVQRRGYRLGASQLRIGTLAYAVLGVVLLAGFAGGAMAIAGLVRALELL